MNLFGSGCCVEVALLTEYGRDSKRISEVGRNMSVSNIGSSGKGFCVLQVWLQLWGRAGDPEDHVGAAQPARWLRLTGRR